MAAWPMSRPDAAMSFCTEVTAAIEAAAEDSALRASSAPAPRAVASTVGVRAEASEKRAVARSVGEAVAAGAVPVRAAAATTPTTTAPMAVRGRRRVRRAARRRSRRLEGGVESERIEPVSREGGRCGCHRPTRVRRARNPEPGTAVWMPPGRRVGATPGKRADPGRIVQSFLPLFRPGASASSGRRCRPPPPGGVGRSAKRDGCVRLGCHTWGSARSPGVPVASHEHIRSASARGIRSPPGVRVPGGPVLSGPGAGAGARHQTQLGQPTT